MLNQLGGQKHCDLLSLFTTARNLKENTNLIVCSSAKSVMTQTHNEQPNSGLGDYHPSILSVDTEPVLTNAVVDQLKVDQTQLHPSSMTICAITTTPSKQSSSNSIEGLYEPYDTLIDRWIHFYGLNKDVILPRLMHSAEELDRLHARGYYEKSEPSVLAALGFMRKELKFSLIERFGVQQYDASFGEQLDENREIAVAQISDKDAPHGVILAQIKAGWIDLKKGLVLRPAEVIQNRIQSKEDAKKYLKKKKIKDLMKSKKN